MFRVMKVEGVEWVQGEKFRAMVKGSDHRYLVDLLEYRGNGKCACQDFQFRCEPKLKGRFEPSDASRCKHIRLAREQLGLRLLDSVIKEMRIELCRNQARKRTSGQARYGYSASSPD